MTSPVIRPITVMIAALGGQGGNVLSRWLINIAENCGYYAQSTSVPGVAQRTGATVYYCEFFDRSQIPAARKPILALMPVSGEVDLVVAAELLEAARAEQRGCITRERTTLVASTHREYTISEKMAPGDGGVDAGAMMARVQAAAKASFLFDMNAIVERDGVFISAVLLGAIARSGALPFPESAYREVIGGSGRAARNNLKGFEAGLTQGADAAETVTSENAARTPADLLARIENLPAPVQDIARYAVTHLIDYQDTAYSNLYLDRLDAIALLDRLYDGEANGFNLSCATAKHLAAWMGFEDTFRVADLKTRREHFDNIRAEVRAGEGQLAYAHEFMKPRVQEICESMPAPVGKFLQANAPAVWVLRRLTGGRKFNTGKIGPFLVLYLLGGMRRWRRSTLRYQIEDARITDWLKLIEDVAPVNYFLAVEIARMQQLIKGYGETHARGQRKFSKAVAALAPIKNDEGAYLTARALRNAALEEESDG
ncbi:MAG: indolepyruvate oxidoreductase subunit beta family protein, partial [Parvularculaceae bacterium]|nr:indolepyruvate oxidoreductase subunit beta family protein [Parvularculaceae bacterium]